MKKKTKKDLKKLSYYSQKKKKKKKKYRTRPKLKVSKLTTNPLFINFLNWSGDSYTIQKFLEGLYDSFEKEEDKEIVQDKELTEEYLNNLTAFQKVFRIYYEQTLVSKSVSEEFLLWMNNSFKYVREYVETYVNDEDRKITIIDPEGRWFESILCYNFILTFNYFGVDILKKCPVCGSYFCHKGKYAKYCSDACKEKGMVKKKK